jgi:hypothetical protein
MHRRRVCVAEAITEKVPAGSESAEPDMSSPAGAIARILQLVGSERNAAQGPINHFSDRGGISPCRHRNQDDSNGLDEVGLADELSTAQHHTVCGGTAAERVLIARQPERSPN